MQPRAWAAILVASHVGAIFLGLMLSSAAEEQSPAALPPHGARPVTLVTVLTTPAFREELLWHADGLGRALRDGEWLIDHEGRRVMIAQQDIAAEGFVLLVAEEDQTLLAGARGAAFMHFGPQTGEGIPPQILVTVDDATGNVRLHLRGEGCVFTVQGRGTGDDMVTSFSAGEPIQVDVDGCASASLTLRAETGWCKLALDDLPGESCAGTRLA